MHYGSANHRPLICLLAMSKKGRIGKDIGHSMIRVWTCTNGLGPQFR